MERDNLSARKVKSKSGEWLPSCPSCAHCGLWLEWFVSLQQHPGNSKETLYDSEGMEKKGKEAGKNLKGH